MKFFSDNRLFGGIYSVNNQRFRKRKIKYFKYNASYILYRKAMHHNKQQNN